MAIMERVMSSVPLCSAGLHLLKHDYLPPSLSYYLNHPLLLLLHIFRLIPCLLYCPLRDHKVGWPFPPALRLNASFIPVIVHLPKILSTLIFIAKTIGQIIAITDITMKPFHQTASKNQLAIYDLNSNFCLLYEPS